jgi:hypothetical protein
MWQVAKCFIVKFLRLFTYQWHAFQSLKDVLITVEDNIFISLTTNCRWDATSRWKLDFDIFASQEHISKIQKSVLITTEENIFIYSNCQSFHSWDTCCLDVTNVKNFPGENFGALHISMRSQKCLITIQ